MSEVITTGNFKGGVGKTTNAVLISHYLSKHGKKCLVVDLDPQFNATRMLFTTMQKQYHVEPAFNNTLEIALKDKNLSEAIVHVKRNLDLLPSYDDLQGYEGFLSKNFADDYTADTYFKRLLNRIKSNYDFIFLDVPPQLNKYTDSALVASNFVIIIMQTQEYSFTGAKTYYEHIRQLKKAYHLDNPYVLGVLPVLQQNGNSTDLDVLADAGNQLGNDKMFNTRIKQMARIKRFTRTGITDNVKHNTFDRRVVQVYRRVSNEMISRIRRYRGDNQ